MFVALNKQYLDSLLALLSNDSMNRGRESYMIPDQEYVGTVCC